MINTGEVAALIKALGSGGVSSSDISEAVSDYLDDHPELVTTVQDGSITYAKLDGSLKDSVDDVSDLKNEIQRNLNTQAQWEQGGISSSNGSNSSSTTRLRTIGNISENIHSISIASGFKFILVAYSGTTYIGMWNGSEFVKSVTWLTDTTVINHNLGYQYRLVLAKSADGTIATSDYSSLGMISITDETLTQKAVPADAGAVGKELSLLESNIESYSYTVDESKLLNIAFSITNKNKWYKLGTSGSQRGTVMAIPDHAVSVNLSTINETAIAFLKTIPEFKDTIHGTTPDFSSMNTGRIVFDTSAEISYKIEPDAKFIYLAKINSAGTTILPSSIVFNLSEPIVNEKIYPYVINDFEIGGINTGDGTGDNNNLTTRARTAGFHEIQNTALININPLLYVSFAYYNENMKFVGVSEFSNGSGIIKRTNVSGAKYVRLIIKKESNTNISLSEIGLMWFVSNDMYGLTKQEGLVRDVPKNMGVLNMISRAKQCSEIAYKTMAVLPNQKSDIAANTEMKGISYSSVRDEGLYVPNCVSFDSYMTSILNPNSYIYTKQSSAPNSKTYLGTVCSAFVSYVLDLPCVYTTHQIGELENIELVEDQSAYGIELGSMLLRIDRHIAICTDIWRDKRGRILYVELTEATTDVTPAKVVSRIFTPAQITANYLNHYGIYNYTKIFKVSYTPSQWVSVEDEIQQDPEYNTNLAPRRGDKANWRYGEDVVIDVTDSEDYTSYKLYMGNTLTDTQAIPSGDVITIENLTTGDYKVCLTDGTNDSDFVYFAVVDATVTVEDQGSGVAKVSFECSENASPVWIAWCYSSGDDVNAVKFAEPITNTDRTNGYRISTYEAGSYKFKVVVQTGYGQYSSDFVQETIT